MSFTLQLNLILGISLLFTSVAIAQNIAATERYPTIVIYDNVGAEIEDTSAGCVSGIASDCLRLGDLHNQTWALAESNFYEGYTRNPTEAAIAYELGCELKHARSCARLAQLSEQEPSLQNQYRTENLYRLACDFGDGHSCVSVALAYTDNPSLKVQTLERACDLTPITCGNLADYLFENFGPEQDQLTLQIIACENNRKESCLTLGWWYFDGINTEQNYFRAFDYFENLCGQDIQLFSNLYDAEACLQAGHQLEDGLGVRQDLLRAKEMYGRACDMEDQTGCENYARLNR